MTRVSSHWSMICRFIRFTSPRNLTQNPPRPPCNETLSSSRKESLQRPALKEVQWIYSHDFHIFAFIHAEDTLDQMVDRVLGYLTKLSLQQKAVFVSIHLLKTGQRLRAPFDAVSEKPRDTEVKTPETPPRPEVPPVVPRDKSRRPVILPGVQDEETPNEREGETWISTKTMHKYPAMKISVEQEEIPKASGISVRGSFSKNTRTAGNPARCGSKKYRENSEYSAPRSARIRTETTGTADRC